MTGMDDQKMSHMLIARFAMNGSISKTLGNGMMKIITRFEKKKCV